MIYLDNGATSFHKPPQVIRAMVHAIQTCANPGRGGYEASLEATKTVLKCRERAAKMFDCQPEQVVFTSNCTHGLNIAIATLVKPGDRVVISGFEHNAVVRPLYALGADVVIAGRKVFDPADTLESFENALKQGAKAAIFTHVSNVFGYILPVEELSKLCVRYSVPFVIDAAQSAGSLPVSLQNTGAAFVAMPGHKGLLGPQGTGMLLCGRTPNPLLFGGTGSVSRSMTMPDFLPDRAEAGTLNVSGIAGLEAGMAWLQKNGMDKIFQKEKHEALQFGRYLQNKGYQVFLGKAQAGTVSFVPKGDCEAFADALSRGNIAVRAGLHCAPLAHESAGTLQTGTVRVSFGHDACPEQRKMLIKTMERIQNFCE